MTESRWWFSPLKIDDAGSELLPSAHKVHEKSEKLNNASSFSIDMRRVFVNKSYDKDEGLRKYTTEKLQEIFHRAESTNDLLIVSNFQTGTAPIVQRIHYLKKGQKINQIVGDFFKTLVCSFSDFKDNHITLQIQVYDIDQYDDIKGVFNSAVFLSSSFIFFCLSNSFNPALMIHQLRGVSPRTASISDAMDLGNDIPNLILSSFCTSISKTRYLLIECRKTYLNLI